MQEVNSNNYWDSKSIEIFLGLIGASINPDNIDGAVKNLDIKSIDWKEVFEASRINGTNALMLPVIQYIQEQYNIIDDDTYDMWKLTTRGIMVYELPKYTAIRRIVNAASDKNIPIVFFKGMILADLYPNYLYRSSCDSDIYVDKKDIKAFEQLLQGLGYKKKVSSSKEEVQVYENSDATHMVEAHTCLWEDYKGPRMNILEGLGLTDADTFINLNACGIDITTLGHEQHLIYQLFHIIKHFSLNGIGVKYLIDITLFVNRYSSQIDVRDFWDKIDRLGYTKFAEYFFYICHKYLGMTDDIYAYRNPVIGDDILSFIVDLISVGNINEREAGWQIMGAMEAYFTGNERISDSKFKRKMQMIFPSVKALPKVYDYAKKYPVLLPVAWIHRDIKFIIKKITQKDNVYGVTEKIDVAENRLYLIKHLGLADAIKDECRDDD